MQKAAFRRQYVILRPLAGCAGGFARLETRQGRGCVTIQVNQVAQSSLRALLMGGSGRTSGMLDLGLMHITAQGRGALYREGLPAGYAACHTVLLCSDWPEPRLQLYGCLTSAPACSPGEMQAALEAYLSVPARDTVLPEPSSLHAVPQPSALAPEARPLCRLSPPSGAMAGSVLRLPRLRWPAPLAELAGYFGQELTCAPFDAPGWRFVRVRLGPGSPAAWCAVGVHIRGCRVVEAAYALPGEQAVLPPGGLHGYRWAEGRHGQGYWVLRSGEMSAPPP
ncbi:MAG: hypothetical protein ACI4ML_13415 [Aristaeellaceae bacterium]